METFGNFARFQHSHRRMTQIKIQRGADALRILILFNIEMRGHTLGMNSGVGATASDHAYALAAEFK